MKLFILFLLLGLHTAGAEVLDPQSYLSKISQRLTGGAWPRPEEYESLEAQMRSRGCSEVSCLQDFFKEYIAKKMDSSEFYSEAVLKVHERFGFQTPDFIPFPPKQWTTSVSHGLGRDSLAVYRILKNNLSIDELYTSQVRWEFEGERDTNFSAFYDVEIETDHAPNFRTFSDDGPAVKGARLTETDYTGHPNVSGFFSSLKFLTRYWNTPVNGNRKRAAAVFKIMMCDPMTPALERMTARAREQALATGVPESKVTARSIEEIHKNRHANQEDCAKCHSRLDPMARTMRPLEVGISKFASKGRLRFYDAVNRPVDFQADNFHDLILQITRHQKYTDCQMNWLFNWIVGKDVKIHPVRFAELLESFEKNGRRMKETIAMLLMSPEFLGREVSYKTPASFERAAEIFSNCRDCHSDFFKSHGAELKLKLSKISFKLDLAHGGLGRQMPPSYYRYWAPSAQDLKVIREWISEGAPLVEGRPTLTSDEVSTVLGGGI